jgi:D-alanyl-D-alanine carboxypeptidase
MRSSVGVGLGLMALVGCAAPGAAPQRGRAPASASGISGPTPPIGDGAIDPTLAAQIQAALVKGATGALPDGTMGPAPLGVTLTVGIGGQGVYAGTVGYGDVAQSHPVVATDRFRIGSITKTFTATLVLQLVAANQLGLDDTLAQHYTLPDGSAFPGGDTITIRQLLSHTSGIYDFLEVTSFDPSDTTHQHDDGIVVAAQQSPYFTPPGSKYHYSNTNYEILGRIVENVTGEQYGARLQAQLLGPLGLADTYLEETNPSGTFVTGTDYVNGALQDVTRFDAPSVAWAAGGIVATAHDLEKWSAALWGEQRILSQDMLTLMTTPPAVPVDDPNAPAGTLSNYGLGAMIQATPWRVGHTGARAGFNSDVRFEPGRNMAVSVITNTQSVEAGAIADLVWQALAGI